VPSKKFQTLTAEKTGERLDLWLHEQFPEQSRSTLQRLIREEEVLLRKKPCTPKATVNIGDVIEIRFPPPKPLELTPEKIPLDVLFEDKHLIVINKPAGIVVHPGAGNEEHTLVHALLHHCKGQLSGIGGVERPGIIHRLDKDTSGCLVIAKTDQAHQGLATAFQEHSVEKIYMAVVWGKPRMLSGVIDQPIGRNPVHRKKMAVTDKGREAVTHWKVLKASDKISFLECRLETGRTHQIRVHLAEIGHSIVGDTTYGKPKDLELVSKVSRQMLHAFRLKFNHPCKEKVIDCTSPVPKEMEKLVATIK
jgi:23S rRNA pseudouridine1911/1915/1917 synthase